jgi:membrane fusion protein, multidrug efflux system
MTHWKRWALVALVLLALSLAVGRALVKREAQQVAAQRAATQQQQLPPLELGPRDWWRVQRVPLELGSSFSGTVRAARTALVKARIAGELQGLVLREGDAVRAGQVLGRIDPTESQARVQQAEQQLQAARAQEAIARRQADNNQALVNQGFISRTALETSTANLDAALANAQAAQAALDLARKALADTVLRSPIDGLVSARLAQSGERVAVDGRVLEIIDTGSLEIEAALAPADALGVRPGQVVQWSVEGVAQSGPSRVLRLAPGAQPGSRAVTAYLSLPAHAGLRHGLFVQGRILTGTQDTVAVPMSAVRLDKPQPYVQVVEGDRVRHVAVRLGVRGQYQGEDMVAVEDLAPGAPLLRASAGAVREDAAVRPLEAAR